MAVSSKLTRKLVLLENSNNLENKFAQDLSVLSSSELDYIFNMYRQNRDNPQRLFDNKKFTMILAKCPLSHISRCGDILSGYSRRLCLHLQKQCRELEPDLHIYKSTSKLSFIEKEKLLKLSYKYGLPRQSQHYELIKSVKEWLSKDQDILLRIFLN